jgi:type VI secretion system secreted protein Hcp
MAIYLNYNSLGIKGDVTQGDHKDWIALHSFQWGVGRGISSAVGNLKNREASEPSVSEVTVTKDLDQASPLLCQDDLINKKGVPIVIDFVRTGDKGDDVYLKLTLTNTLISGYSLSSGGDKPSESLTLNFTKFEYSYTGMKEDGTPDTPNKFIYDMATAGKSS